MRKQLCFTFIPTVNYMHIIIFQSFVVITQTYIAQASKVFSLILLSENENHKKNVSVDTCIVFVPHNGYNYIGGMTYEQKE